MELETRKLDIELQRFDQETRLKQDEFKVKVNKNKLANGPKLPYFDENCDDVESYLFHFHKHATLFDWSEEEKG